MKNLKGIVNALEKGNELNCWVTHDRAIAVITNLNNENLAEGESQSIGTSIQILNADWGNYLNDKRPSSKRKQRTVLVGNSDEKDHEVFDTLDRWVYAHGGHLKCYYEDHSEVQVFVVFLHGYDASTNRIVMQGCGKNLVEAIENAFKAEPYQNK